MNGRMRRRGMEKRQPARRILTLEDVQDAFDTAPPSKRPSAPPLKASEKMPEPRQPRKQPVKQLAVKQQQTKPKRKKTGNFVIQGTILAAAGIIVRLIGLMYRIPMTNIIGDEGMGYYSTAFNVYNIVLILSPTACLWLSPRWFQQGWPEGSSEMPPECSGHL